MIFAFASFLTMSSGHEVRAAAEYEFTLIEAFEVDYDLREVMLRDINDSGRVVGSSTHQGFYSGFVWTQQTEKVIVPMSWPMGINNHNQIVSDGTILQVETGNTTLVPPAGGYPVPRLQAINDNGIAVGFSECSCSNSNRVVQTALVWDSGSHTIPVVGAKELLRINNGNIAVGNIRGGTSGSEGFVYDLGSQATVNMSNLLPANGFVRGWSELQDVSETNVAVGRGWDGTFVRGLTWSSSTGFTFLPGLPNGLVDRVYPRGVNGAGTVVGFADVTPYSPHAFVWTAAAGMRDLNDLTVAPAGFILDWALKVNEQGLIVGVGHYGPNWGTSRGFVLRPMNGATDVVLGPEAFDLRVAPNPMRGEAMMQFSLPQAGDARLTVYDVAGTRGGEHRARPVHRRCACGGLAASGNAAVRGLFRPAARSRHRTHAAVHAREIDPRRDERQCAASRSSTDPVSTRGRVFFRAGRSESGAAVTVYDSATLGPDRRRSHGRTSYPFAHDHDSARGRVRPGSPRPVRRRTDAPASCCGSQALHLGR
jgi:probable HAF family extracellular repeat protein